MTDLMELLYEYTQDNRLAGFVERRTYETAEHMEVKNLTALKAGLSGEHLAALERYQDACRERHALELEAMFLAAFSIARELR